MLHIKMPKGKISQACERAGDQCSRRIAVANNKYLSDVERWRKDGGDMIPPDKPISILMLTTERQRLHFMADMVKHSTGDVYVSPELWSMIKGYYDV